MESITYQGKEYPTRTFDAYLAEEDEDGIQTITIATNLLSDAMDYRQEFEGSIEQKIDNTIYFYVDVEAFELDAETICLEHLDEPFILVNEYED
jgi:hypothetical protein